MEQNMESDLTCPVCGLLLHEQDKTFKCGDGHAFDRAKEGYVNLLAIQNKQSLNPGDTKEMVQARRRFLSLGHYAKLQHSIAEMWIKHLGSDRIVMLDLGCGEGYYCNLIYNNARLNFDKFYGCDISKAAVKAAAKKNKDIQYFVASASDIALADETLDAVQSIFSPLDTEELNRVMHPSGLLLTVTAGPNHMKEMALMVYDTFRPHGERQAAKLEALYEEVEQSKVEYDIELVSSEAVMDLLHMTPYYWKINEEKKAKVAALKGMKVRCDFVITVYKKKGE